MNRTSTLAEACWLCKQARYLPGYPTGHPERVRFFERKAGFFARVGMLSHFQRAYEQSVRERARLP